MSTVALTQYQQAIAAAIQAAGHEAAWTATPATRTGALLSIDGRRAGYDERLGVPHVESVDGVGFMEPTRFRGRKLSADPQKAAAALLERFAAAVQAEHDRKARDSANNARDALRERLAAAFVVPGGNVRVESGVVTVSIVLDTLTPETAKRLADAINGALAESGASK